MLECSMPAIVTERAVEMRGKIVISLAFSSALGTSAADAERLAVPVAYQGRTVELSGELAIAGSVCYAAVLAIALATNVRINKQIARWSVHRAPDGWTLIRASWVRFHIVRTLFSLPGLACYVLACLVGR